MTKTKRQIKLENQVFSFTRFAFANFNNDTLGTSEWEVSFDWDVSEYDQTQQSYLLARLLNKQLGHLAPSFHKEFKKLINKEVA